MSNLVLAERYELKVPASIKDNTWKSDGQKELKAKKKLISRNFALSRIESGKMYDQKGKEIENIRSNNELYIIYEEETVEVMKQRDKNIIKNAEKAKKEKMGMSDLVDAVVNKSEKPKAKKKEASKKVESNDTKSVDDMDKDELKKYCDDNELKYHHKAGKEKLLEIIKS